MEVKNSCLVQISFFDELVLMLFGMDNDSLLKISIKEGSEEMK